MAEAPKKRGRPRLTEAEKKRRAAEKAARPRKKPGPKKGSTRKAKQTKPAPVVIMANAEGINEGPKVEGETGGDKTGPGAKTKYCPEMLEDARRMAEAGFTDLQMFEHLGIGRTTFYNWKKLHPEFRDAIRIAKEEPDNQMERSLYHSGNGFEYFEEVPVKVKEIEYDNGRKVKETERVEVVQVKRTVPPNSTAQIFWLKNRRPDIWRDKKEIDVNPHEDWLSRLAEMEGADA
jgi:hypothetical protein